MAYGFSEQTPARVPVRPPARQPMAGARPGAGTMGARPPMRPQRQAAPRQIFNPEQVMEIRRIIQQELRR